MQYPDPQVSGRVQIRNKMSRIHNTAPRTQKGATNLASTEKKTKVLVLDS
jgi:hypothetical protein